jgi:hypothetical protein
MAQPEPTPSPDNRRRDLVTVMHDRYMQTLDLARQSADLTATEGWQAMYGAFRKSQRDASRSIANELRGYADFIEKGDSSEDTEKAINEAKKSLVLLREERSVFEAKVAWPVKDAVDECRNIITEAMRQAQRDEEAAPMVNIGLLDVMRDRIKSWPKALWDAETGRVTIRTDLDAE